MIDYHTMGKAFLDFVYDCEILPEEITYLLKKGGMHRDVRKIIKLLAFRNEVFFTPKEDNCTERESQIILKEIAQEARDSLSDDMLCYDVSNWLSVDHSELQTLYWQWNAASHDDEQALRKRVSMFVLLHQIINDAPFEANESEKKKKALATLWKSVAISPFDNAEAEDVTTLRILLNNMTGITSQTKKEPAPAPVTQPQPENTAKPVSDADKAPKVAPSLVYAFCEKNGHHLGALRNMTSLGKANNFWADVDLDRVSNDWDWVLNDVINRRVIILHIPANTFTADDFYYWESKNKLSLILDPNTFVDVRIPNGKDLSGFITKIIPYTDIR